MPEAFEDRPELSENEEFAVDAWLECSRHRPVTQAGIGWIPLETMMIWFDLHAIAEYNRSWYYTAMTAIDTGYMHQKAEQAEKESNAS